MLLALLAPLSFAPPAPELSNRALSVAFYARGLKSVSLLASKATVLVQNDAFTFRLADGVINSSQLAAPTITLANTSHVIYSYEDTNLPAAVSVAYELGASAAYVTKTLHLQSISPTATSLP